LAQAEQRLQSARASLETARREFYAAKAVASQLRRQTMPPIEAAIEDIGRRRYKQFARALVRLIRDGNSVIDASRKAVAQIYPSRKSQDAIVRKAERWSAGRRYPLSCARY
jgi:hypothetical protein